MGSKEINKSLRDTLSTIVLVTLALILSLRVFPFAIILFPIPFIILGINHSLKNSIVAIIVSSIAIGLALDIPSGIFMLVLSFPLIISLVTLIKEEYKPGQILLISTMALFISILALVFVSSILSDVEFLDRVDKLLKVNIENQLEVFKDLGMEGEGLKNIEETLELAHENILVTLPSLFIIISLGISYINYGISTWILRKENYKLKYRPVFSEFKLPKSIFLGTMMMFVLSYIFNKLNILNGEGLIRNLVVLLTFIFSIQGLSVLDYLMIKRGMKKFGRILTFVLFIFLLRLGSFMSFIGVLDSIMDFRKSKRINNS